MGGGGGGFNPLGIFGGGGGGGTTYNVSQPASPTPIDYDKMYAAATRSAIDQMREQGAQIQRLVPTYENLQFNTVNRLAKGLDNQYLATLRRTISSEMGAAATPASIEAEVQRRAQADLMRGPSEADRQIQRAGMSAMRTRADQVSGPRNIREVRSAQAQFVGGPQAAMARNVADMRAAQMGPVQGVSAVNAQRVADVRSQDVGSGQLGEALMAQAMKRAQSGGRLSAEAGRDATQAARAGMAARGMATGSAGLAAELLNRDRFTRQRQAEDNAFAQSVQGQDIQRQFGNQEAAMRAAMANQQVGAQMSLADQAAAMDAQRLNQAAGLTIGQTNAQLAQQAGLANQDMAGRLALSDQAAMNQMALAGYQGSIEQRQAQAQRDQQANLSNQQRDQVLGEMAMRAQMANQAANQNQLMQNRAFMLDANAAFLGSQDRLTNNALGANQLDLARRQRLLGLAGGYAELDPFSRAINPAFQVGTANTSNASGLIGQTFGNSLNAAGNAQSFNANMQAGMYNNWMNNNAAIQAAGMTGRATQQAGQMAMMGGIAQGLGSVNWSDKRMKKDIKPVGKGGGVLGLTAYEYRYKGEDKDAPKHVGFMAQDVQKVLPEAVEELTHKGKKRLAIKPQVIGQALAAELEAQQEAMFAEGYTVK